MTRVNRQKDGHRRFTDPILQGGVTALIAGVALLTLAPAARGQGAVDAGPVALPAHSQVDARPVAAIGLGLYDPAQEALTASQVAHSRWDVLADRRVETAEGLKPWENQARSDFLWNAANLHFYSGDRQAAYRNYTAAADAALDSGNVYQAARANLRAAYVAFQLGDEADVRDLLNRVRELKDYPRLTPAEQRTLKITADGLDTTV